MHFSFYYEPFIGLIAKKLAKSGQKIKGKHAYSHHAQMGLAFLANLITPIDEYYNRVKVRLG